MNERPYISFLHILSFYLQEVYPEYSQSARRTSYTQRYTFSSSQDGIQSRDMVADYHPDPGFPCDYPSPSCAILS